MNTAATGANTSTASMGSMSSLAASTSVLREELESGLYTAHDAANILKSFLGDLPEPLLTEKHYPAYCQVAGVYFNNDSEWLAQKCFG